MKEYCDYIRTIINLFYSTRKKYNSLKTFNRIQFWDLSHFFIYGHQKGLLFNLCILTWRNKILCPFPSADSCKHSIFSKIRNFPDYRELSVPADRNEYRIWILQVKKKKLKSISSIRKLPAIPKTYSLFRKLMVDNPDYHAITLTKKKGNKRQNFFYYRIFK